MATPTASGGVGTIETNIANDAHIGGQHGWVEWVRVVVDEQCVLATPLNAESKLESWRPILEFGGGGWEWAHLVGHQAAGDRRDVRRIHLSFNLLNLLFVLGDRRSVRIHL